MKLFINGEKVSWFKFMVSKKNEDEIKLANLVWGMITFCNKEGLDFLQTIKEGKEIKVIR